MPHWKQRQAPILWCHVLYGFLCAQPQGLQEYGRRSNTGNNSRFCIATNTKQFA